MLKEIRLKSIGPSSTMQLEFAGGLNIFTGDNGLGKTLFLDLAWWALTRTWAHLPAWPNPDMDKASIEYVIQDHKSNEFSGISRYDYNSERWEYQTRKPVAPGIVIYAGVDGGFSVWDRARNNKPQKDPSIEDPTRPQAYHFSTEEVWDGLRIKNNVLCNGLIQDWVNWQYAKKQEFKRLTTALEGLSPHPTERIAPGEPIRTSVSDVRDIPTIDLPYGRIPVTHASSGMRRIIALAYLLIWTLSEHRQAARLTKQPPANQIIFLMDEVESHLHPQWQRVLLPSILNVIRELETEIDVQMIVTTHAPLVLASIETMFNSEKDKLINFEINDGRVDINEIPWAKQGDVINWLVSDAFDLSQARSVEAERAIKAAEAYMRSDMSHLSDGLTTQDEIHEELLRVLPGHDTFWPRWVVNREQEQEKSSS